MHLAVAARLLVVAAVAASFSVGSTASTASSRQTVEQQVVERGATALLPSTTRPSDAALTLRLRTVADSVRKAAGREPLFARQTYLAASTTMATALTVSEPVVAPPGNAPSSYVSGVTTTERLDEAITAAVGAVVAGADEVLRYPLHTDGGWAVVTRDMAGGWIGYGVVLVVGWPAPPVSVNEACVAASGYCWSARGLNPHLPWTRNQVKWYLSTSGMPAAAESLLKTAIAKLNAVPGFGADLVYGGRTTATRPTASQRFVVVWGSGCATSALACTTDGTQGTYDFVYQGRVVVTASRYAANPSTTWWVGTLMHELAHATGLGHFDGTYLGSYQLMRWANGPNAIKPGDANGLRRIAPPGRLSGSLRAVRNGAAYTLVVRTASTGLGGVRSVRTECADAAGTYRTVAVVSGKWDIRAADRTAGSYTPPAGATRRCRAVVKSKAASYTTPSVTVTG